MRKFWWHKGRLRVAPSFRSINPFREKRNTDTRHAIFSLWGNSVWSHCLEKSVKTSFYIFFLTYKSLNYNWMEWSQSTEPPPRICLEHLQTWNIICYIKYMWSYYRWCKQWSMGSLLSQGWGVVRNIQVQFTHSLIHIHMISASFWEPKRSMRMIRRDM